MTDSETKERSIIGDGTLILIPNGRDSPIKTRFITRGKMMGNRIPRRVVLFPCFLFRTHFRPLWLPPTAICVPMLSAASPPVRDLETGSRHRGSATEDANRMCDSGGRVSWQSGKRQANTCAQPSNVQRRFGAGGLSDPGTAGSIFYLPLHRRVLVDKLAESIGLFEPHDVISFLLAIGFKTWPVINDSHVSFIPAKRNLQK